MFGLFDAGHRVQHHPNVEAIGECASDGIWDMTWGLWVSQKINLYHLLSLKRLAYSKNQSLRVQIIQFPSNSHSSFNNFYNL